MAPHAVEDGEEALVPLVELKTNKVGEILTSIGEGFFEFPVYCGGLNRDRRFDMVNPWKPLARVWPLTGKILILRT